MSEIGVLGIDNLLLDVGDLEAARAFYGGLLGEPRELRTGWVVEVADPWGNVAGLTDDLHAPERARGGPAA